VASGKVKSRCCFCSLYLGILKIKNTDSKVSCEYVRLFCNIEKHITLDHFDKDYLKANISFTEIPKKELLFEQGKFCRKLFFVESGSLRAYNLTEKGKEATIMFAVQDWWITDMHSFLDQKPAVLSLETLEDSKLFTLYFDAFEELLRKIPKFERFFRILFQKAYVREQLRVLDSISLSTEERYQKFRMKYPQIVEKVTQKQIASHLGVTPEFLSAVKKK